MVSNLVYEDKFWKASLMLHPSYKKYSAEQEELVQGVSMLLAGVVLQGFMCWKSLTGHSFVASQDPPRQTIHQLC